jgi:archaellum component FlaC
MGNELWALEQQIRRLEETVAAECNEIKGKLQSVLEQVDALDEEIRRTRQAIVQEHRSDRRLIQAIRR